MRRAGNVSENDSAQLFLEIASQLESRGQLREAAALYERARGHGDGGIDCSRRLAFIYERTGQPERAAAEYKLAVDAAPGDADLLNDFGYFQYGQGQLPQAEQLLRQALKAEATHAPAQINLGLVLAAQQRWQEAYDMFVPVVGPAAAHSNVGVMMARQGLREPAEWSLRQALAREPGLEPARHVLTVLATMPGQGTVARETACDVSLSRDFPGTTTEPDSFNGLALDWTESPTNPPHADTSRVVRIKRGPDRASATWDPDTGNSAL